MKLARESQLQLKKKDILDATHRQIRARRSETESPFARKFMLKSDDQLKRQRDQKWLCKNMQTF